MNYSSLLNLKKLQGAAKEQLPSPPQHTPSPTVKSADTTQRPTFQSSTPPTMAPIQDVSDDSNDSASASSVSSTDSVILTSNTEYAHATQQDTNIEFIVHHPHLAHLHHPRPAGGRPHGRSFGSVLATSPKNSQKTDGNADVGRVDIHVHKTAHSPHTRAITARDVKELDPVQVTTNSMYDMRILGDNPRDFSNTDTVLKNVELGQEARDILKSFKHNRELRTKRSEQVQGRAAGADGASPRRSRSPDLYQSPYNSPYEPYAASTAGGQREQEEEQQSEITLFEYVRRRHIHCANKGRRVCPTLCKKGEGRVRTCISFTRAHRISSESITLSSRRSKHAKNTLPRDLYVLGQRVKSVAPIYFTDSRARFARRYGEDPPENPADTSERSPERDAVEPVREVKREVKKEEPPPPPPVTSMAKSKAAVTIGTPTQAPTDDALLDMEREVELLHETIMGLGLASESLSFSFDD